jgi:hypothetical protein
MWFSSRRRGVEDGLDQREWRIKIKSHKARLKYSQYISQNVPGFHKKFRVVT